MQMLTSFFAPLADLSPIWAQARRGITPQQQKEILFWSVVLVAIAVVLGIAGYLVYRKLRKANETNDTEAAGFSLSEVRRLYEAGEVSHDEYVQVKEKVLEAARRSMALDGPLVRVQPDPAPPATPPVREDAAGDGEPADEAPGTNREDTPQAMDDHDPLEPPRFDKGDGDRGEERPPT